MLRWIIGTRMYNAIVNAIIKGININLHIHGMTNAQERRNNMENEAEISNSVHTHVKNRESQLSQDEGHEAIPDLSRISVPKVKFGEEH